MRTVFFGTPEMAVPSLTALARTTEVVGVVCQPDRPAGRGLRLCVPPVKTAALQLGLPVHQPVKVKTGNLHEWLAERQTDVVVVMAYGRILPPPVLRAPTKGCFNLHASVLPRYRGAAPVNWAIIRGESETGISLMHMDEGLDTGPVFAVRRLSISADETAGELASRLAELAAEVVREDLPRAVTGQLEAKAQDDPLATWAPPITREHCQIDWSRSAREIVCLVRGLAPRPGAHTTVAGRCLRILAAREVSNETGMAAGAVSLSGCRPNVRTGKGSVELLSGQLEGRRVCAGTDLVNGRILRTGDTLGS
ncbi:MAG: methionyl-tRNA formyltransferase [Polyangiaceae bacterium]|nr:methionyl-tRNA formyltransferase [Polyangiaceae bacterium]